jgi:acetylglutamate kinase
MVEKSITMLEKENLITETAAALPTVFIIKVGGNIIDKPTALQLFLENFSAIKAHKILVHGGGKIATKIGEALGIQSNYIDGRRITDDATLDLVTMVYGGLVNKQMVAKLQALQCNAIGLTGADANCIPATKRAVTSIDYGWVGDINTNEVSTHFFSTLLQQNITPIIAPLTHNKAGCLLNTNADTIAANIAIALSSSFTTKLIYCFEKKGILDDINNEDSVISNINTASYQQLIADNKLFAGILPKLHNAFNAINHGVTSVLIGLGDDVIANTTDLHTGTLITK